jgi:hypothetical protein
VKALRLYDAEGLLPPAGELARRWRALDSLERLMSAGDLMPFASSPTARWSPGRTSAGREPVGTIRLTYLADPARVPAPELLTRTSIPLAPTTTEAR